MSQGKTPSGRYRSDEERGDVRTVSRVLVDLDLMFTIGRGSDEQPFWEMDFETGDSNAPRRVTITLNNRLAVVFTETSVLVDDLNRAKQLLELNLRTQTARIGMSPDHRIIVCADVPITEVNEARMRNVIGGVLSAAAEVTRPASA